MYTVPEDTCLSSDVANFVTDRISAKSVKPKTALKFHNIKAEPNSNNYHIQTSTTITKFNSM